MKTPSSNTALLQGTLDVLILKVLALEPLHGLGHLPAYRPSDGQHLPGQARVAFSSTASHGGGRLAEFQLGRIGEHPSSQVLPAHQGRRSPAQTRNRSVGAHLSRDGQCPRNALTEGSEQSHVALAQNAMAQPDAQANRRRRSHAGTPFLSSHARRREVARRNRSRRSASRCSTRNGRPGANQGTRSRRSPRRHN